MNPAPIFTRAIVRLPSPEMVAGITTADLGLPDFDLAMAQHAAYIAALRHLGLEVTVLPALPEFPDACFIEDVALCTPACAIVTRPGAESRRGEIEGLQEVLELAGYAGKVFHLEAPATLDAGDIMMVGSHFYIGLSARTNHEGARQLGEILRKHGMEASTVPLSEFLHLKTGVTYMEQGRILVTGEFSGIQAFADFEQLYVDSDEAYAANAIYVNGTVILPAGFPKAQALLEHAGYPVMPLEMSEFQKLDGGLSCLSLRF